MSSGLRTARDDPITLGPLTDTGLDRPTNMNVAWCRAQAAELDSLRRVVLLAGPST
jgi:hypothetical protein